MSSDVSYISKIDEPEKFYALCEKNIRDHRIAIQESYERLEKEGVHEKFIFVVNANRGDPAKQGDIFSYSNTERLEEALTWIKEKANVCHSPDVFVFICVDIRDYETMSLYISRSYFRAKWFKEMVAKYTT